MTTPHPRAPARVDVRDAGHVASSGVEIVGATSFAVQAGERVAIVGPNGAGKTTLLRLLSGRIEPTRGSVLIDGEPVGSMPAGERARRVAILSQGEPAALSLRVADYVALGRIPWRQQVSARMHAQAVAQALRDCGLEAKADRSLATLSGGERQRASIARAIAQQPGLLLLDEPTNHLDLRARADMLDIVRDLGVTTIAVLHDLQLVGRFADRVLVMDRGAVVADGSPSQALGADTVRRVFGLDVFEAAPRTGGAPVLVFEAPTRVRQGSAA